MGWGRHGGGGESDKWWQIVLQVGVTVRMMIILMMMMVITMTMMMIMIKMASSRCSYTLTVKVIMADF